MKFSAVDIEEVQGRFKLHKPCKTQKFLEDFANSRMPVAEIFWKSDYKSAQYCYNCVTSSAKRYGMHHLKLARRGERVFIFNTLVGEE